MRIKVVFVLIAALFLCACSKKKAPYRTEIIDGITVVHNLRIDPEKAYKDLAFVEDLTIGVEEGEADYMLYSPVDIDADLDGNLYILDMKDAWVKKYDPEGLFICNIGRKGKGPGEFDRPNHMEIDSANRIIVADPYQRRFEFLSRDGDYLKSVRMGPYVSSLESGQDGSILAGYGWYESDGTQEYRIGRLDEESGKIKDLFTQKQYWPARLQNDQLRYDFPYFVRSAIDSQNRIIAGAAIEYEFSVFHRDGELEFKFNKAFDRIPVKGEMLAQIENITLKGPNPYVKNPYFPVFESLSIDEEDNIWIQQYQPKWTGKINTETVYDVFSDKGIFLFTTKIPGHIRGILKFKNGFIYALRSNEAGFIEMVRLRHKK
jgi:hypothetical protein